MFFRASIIKIPIMLALYYMFFKPSIIKTQIMLALYFTFFIVSIIKIPIMLALYSMFFKVSIIKTPRGRSQTTWTNFWPILTTYLPIVDFRGHLVHHLPLVHVDIEKPDHQPPMYNMYLVLQLLLSRRGWGYNCQVFSGLLTNTIIRKRYWTS